MEEIEEVVGDKTTVEADDLDKLTYMNQVPVLQKCALSLSIIILVCDCFFIHCTCTGSGRDPKGFSTYSIASKGVSIRWCNTVWIQDTRESSNSGTMMK